MSVLTVLRSRDEPETPEKHETGLKCAEALVRRNPPDLPHRAAELSRDLLYLENAYDLEVPKVLLILGIFVWGVGVAFPGIQWTYDAGKRSAKVIQLSHPKWWYHSIPLEVV